MKDPLRWRPWHISMYKYAYCILHTPYGILNIQISLPHSHRTIYSWISHPIVNTTALVFGYFGKLIGMLCTYKVISVEINLKRGNGLHFSVSTCGNRLFVTNSFQFLVFFSLCSPTEENVEIYFRSFFLAPPLERLAKGVVIGEFFLFGRICVQ